MERGRSTRGGGGRSCRVEVVGGAEPQAKERGLTKGW
jgi:hypothetical protein